MGVKRNAHLLAPNGQDVAFELCRGFRRSRVAAENVSAARTNHNAIRPTALRHLHHNVCQIGIWADRSVCLNQGVRNRLNFEIIILRNPDVSRFLSLNDSKNAMYAGPSGNKNGRE